MIKTFLKYLRRNILIEELSIRDHFCWHNIVKSIGEGRFPHTFPMWLVIILLVGYALNPVNPIEMAIPALLAAFGLVSIGSLLVNAELGAWKITKKQ